VAPSGRAHTLIHNEIELAKVECSDFWGVHLHCPVSGIASRHSLYKTEIKKSEKICEPVYLALLFSSEWSAGRDEVTSYEILQPCSQGSAI
ncbi:MAG: hypothetical protein ACI3X9_07875, partial [Bacteroidaceae bacterium]